MRNVRSAVIVGAAAVMVALSVPNAQSTADPRWADQYGPTQIGGPPAWTKATGQGVTIAIVDSGVDVDHPDLRGKIDFENSRDFGCNDNNPDDDSTIRDGNGALVKGHGTHVAGTAAAITGNNVGVAGMAPNSRIMALKVFPTDDNCNRSLLGAGAFSAVPDAIQWAVDRGAKVINLSLGTFSFGGGLVGFIETPCRNAFAQGALCVVAAGNSGESKSSGYPRDLPVLNVTANDSAGRHAGFGQKADTMWGVSAPGVAVLNTWPMDDPNHDGYNAIQGTSMAAPHVAGAAAVLFSMGMTARQVAETLVKTAGPARDSTIEGAGIIHLDKAVGVDAAALAGGTTATTARASQVVRGASGANGASGATGASGAAVTTPVTLPSEADPSLLQESADFEEGLAGAEADKSFDERQLAVVSKNGGKPFNAVIPIAVISVIAMIAAVAVAIPRLRTKDTPSI